VQGKAGKREGESERERARARERARPEEQAASACDTGVAGRVKHSCSHVRTPPHGGELVQDTSVDVHWGSARMGQYGLWGRGGQEKKAWQDSRCLF
jgi:hypothetical protein